MRLLLDTHALLALLSDDYPLSENARAAMEQPDAELAASAVNVWEIAIKRSVGKLRAPAGLLARLRESGAEVLTIGAHHADAVADLPHHHRDPFDRLLIAQARIEGCAIVTRDSAFARYGVPVVW